MARPRKEWPAEKLNRMRDLVAAGVSAASICIILEDEFGGTCSEPTLKQRAEEYGVRWPGQAAANRANAQLPPWSDAKIRRFKELKMAGATNGEIIRALRDEFGIVHGKTMLNKKARECGLAIPRPRRLVDAVARDAIQQDGGFSDLKIASPPCPILSALFANCQYPIGEPGKRNFRFCGDPVPLGWSYCKTHYQVCYMPRFRPEADRPVPQESEATAA
jgi:hypothetical protein